MQVSLELIESLLNSLDCRFEREKMSLAGTERVEIRLFNQMTGEQSARLEFGGGSLVKIDYWDKERKTIETVDWSE